MFEQERRMFVQWLRVRHFSAVQTHAKEIRVHHYFLDIFVFFHCAGNGDFGGFAFLHGCIERYGVDIDCFLIFSFAMATLMSLNRLLLNVIKEEGIMPMFNAVIDPRDDLFKGLNALFKRNMRQITQNLESACFLLID
jgi:hypothetical protein